MIEAKKIGTDELTEALRSAFPAAKIEKFDRDEITTQNKLEKTLKAFNAGEIDALVGMAGARQLALEPEIFRYLLTYWRRDMDSLVQMLDTLCHYAATTRRRITLPLLRQLLKQQDTP